MAPADATSKTWALIKWEFLPDYEGRAADPGKKFVKLYFDSGGYILDMSFKDQDGKPLQRIASVATAKHAAMVLQIDNETTIISYKLSKGRL